MAIRIPECDEYPHCPKCHRPVGEFGSIRFHATAIRRYDASMDGEEPCGALLYVHNDDRELLEELNKGHLCRKCRNCGFGWVERPYNRDDIYEDRPCGCDHHGDHAGCDDDCECASEAP